MRCTFCGGSQGCSIRGSQASRRSGEHFSDVCNSSSRTTQSSAAINASWCAVAQSPGTKLRGMPCHFPSPVRHSASLLDNKCRGAHECTKRPRQSLSQQLDCVRYYLWQATQPQSAAASKTQGWLCCSGSVLYLSQAHMPQQQLADVACTDVLRAAGDSLGAAGLSAISAVAGRLNRCRRTLSTFLPAGHAQPG